MNNSAPCWYPLLGKTGKERLVKYRRHCLRLIYPNLEDSASRLDTAGLATLSVQLANQSNAIGTLSAPALTPPTPSIITSIGGRISSRSGRFIPARTRTALGSKNLFRHYSFYPTILL